MYITWIRYHFDYLWCDYVLKYGKPRVRINTDSEINIWEYQNSDAMVGTLTYNIICIWAFSLRQLAHDKEIYDKVVSCRG
jgi:hypothetical protein